MATYIAHRDTWLSHENRLAKAGDKFETTFPKVKGADGKETDMRLGDNLELVEDEKPAKSGKPKPGGKPEAEKADDLA